MNEAEIVAWGNETFPDSEPMGIYAHLEEEVDELWCALDEVDFNGNTHYRVRAIKEEIGDMGILLVHLASKYGTTLEECIANKFASAREREYAYDPEAGYMKHVG